MAKLYLIYMHDEVGVATRNEDVEGLREGDEGKDPMKTFSVGDGKEAFALDAISAIHNLSLSCGESVVEKLLTAVFRAGIARGKKQKSK